MSAYRYPFLCLARSVVRYPSALGRRTPQSRTFSQTTFTQEMQDATHLPNRITPRYNHIPASISDPITGNTYSTDSESFMSLTWPAPPRNVLLIPKLQAPHVLDALAVFISYIWSNYPGLNIILEPKVAEMMHEHLPCLVYTGSLFTLPAKVDVVATLGGDGTILRAARLFGMHTNVPPMLSFSMGSLGFLGEWKFEEYKRAWREVYMSGSGVPASDLQAPHTRLAASGVPDVLAEPAAWPANRGKSMGAQRGSRMLLRHRLTVSVHDESGRNINHDLIPADRLDALRVTGNAEMVGPSPAFHAVNELLIHRGEHPHLAIMDISINGQFLTEAVADGILLSTPTGSTAYSLSAGGAIVHPWVKSLLITPICPRSLSFRPLVLPLNARVSLKLSKKNRGHDLEVSIDGKRFTGIRSGMEIQVGGERLRYDTGMRSWRGGVPCVLRVPRGGKSEGEIAEEHDGWVAGLNGLLKFNYPFGKS